MVWNRKWEKKKKRFKKSARALLCRILIIASRTSRSKYKYVHCSSDRCYDSSSLKAIKWMTNICIQNSKNTAESLPENALSIPHETYAAVHALHVRKTAFTVEYRRSSPKANTLRRILCSVGIVGVAIFLWLCPKYGRIREYRNVATEWIQ
jgi:hypothetical protein